MTLQQLRYVIKIVQAGSMNLAAQQLFISQPSLSKAIAELEKEMQITIFERSNRGVVLTDSGSRFLSYARQVVEQADLLEHQYKSLPLSAMSNRYLELLQDYVAGYNQKL